MNEMKY